MKKQTSSKHKTPKTKYTLRSDGRIVRTEIINGERKYFYGRSDEEVNRKYEEFIRPKVHTLRSVVDAWWEKKEPTLSPNTRCGYRAQKDHIAEEFGELEISDITPQDIITFLQRFAVQGYSQKVINNYRSVLSMIFDEAFIAGYIDRNPCYGLPVIKGETRKPRQAASKDDIKKIEASKTENNFARMSYFMLYTGVRRGEAAALQQKHIDRKRKVAHIVQAVAYAETRRPELKAPKSASGIRTVELLDNVLEILPKSRDPEAFVFFPKGLPTKTELEAGLKEYQTSHGISATAHQLRHSYASMLHSAGIDVKDAQHLLGHSTVAMTQDIYTHLEEDHKKTVRKKLNDYVVKTVVKNQPKP